MANIKLGPLAKRSFTKSTIYTPIVEAIVNGINAIEDKNGSIGTGEITVKFIRDNQQSFDFGEGNENTPSIIGVEISDNGIGFNDENLKSFSTVYSDYKENRGGLGFGRISYIKFFDSVKIVSRFEKEGTIYERRWTFTPDNELSEYSEGTSTGNTGTTLMLTGIKKGYINSFHKNFDVLIKNTCISLLGYYAFEYDLPKITFIDSMNTNTSITFSDFLEETDKISKIVDREDFEINGHNFKISFLKISHTQLGNSVNLCAGARSVVRYPMGDIEKLFQDDFRENNTDYIISVYVASDYLDDNVNSERDGFNLPQNDQEAGGLLYPELDLPTDKIKERIGEKLREHLNNIYLEREQQKQAKIDKFFEENPMYNIYKDEINGKSWSNSVSGQEISLEISKMEFINKEKVYEKLQKIKDGTIVSEDDVNEILLEVSDINKIELAKYVINRKKILEILESKLDYINKEKPTGKDSDYEKENVLHNIVYPTRRTSDNTYYDEHNLWLLDERLSYSLLISSDNSIEPDAIHGDRGDIVFFEDAIALREGGELQNPVIIVEFKRPGRENYKPDEDPIKQVGRYAKKIRSGSMNTNLGRRINATQGTPVYGYIVCDLTDPIKQFATDNSLTPTPDGDGYIGFHPGYSIYFEIMSWDKVVKDANQRNKIFFKKLGIE